MTEHQLKDYEIAKKLLDQCDTEDHESDHGTADNILVELLEQLGYQITANTYKKLQENFWYA